MTNTRLATITMLIYRWRGKHSTSAKGHSRLSGVSTHPSLSSALLPASGPTTVLPMLVLATLMLAHSDSATRQHNDADDAARPRHQVPQQRVHSMLSRQACAQQASERKDHDRQGHLPWCPTPPFVWTAPSFPGTVGYANNAHQSTSPKRNNRTQCGVSLKKTGQQSMCCGCSHEDSLA